MYWKMITTMILANTFVMYDYHFLFVLRAFQIYSSSNFQGHNTVLLTVITIPLLHLVATLSGLHSLPGHQSREKERTGEYLGGKLHIPFAHLPLA